MKREIEQIWFKAKLPHIAAEYASIDYLGPELRSIGRKWSGYIDYETREYVLRLETSQGTRTYRGPYDGMVKTFRGAPTKAKAGQDSE